MWDAKINRVKVLILQFLLDNTATTAATMNATPRIISIPDCSGHLVSYHDLKRKNICHRMFWTDTPDTYLPLHEKVLTTTKTSSTRVAMVLFPSWTLIEHAKLNSYLKDITSAAFFRITRACMCEWAFRDGWAIWQVLSAKLHFVKFYVVTWKNLRELGDL